MRDVTRASRSTSLLSPGSLALLALVLSIVAAAALMAFGGTPASASTSGGTSAQATVAPGTKVPAPVQSAGPLSPVGTQVAAPGSVLTPRAGTPATTTPSSGSGGFPWLPVVLGGLVVVALAGFALMRPRRTTTVVTNSTPAPTTVMPKVGRAPDTSPVSTTTTTTTVMPVATAAPAKPMPTQITCPNCQAVNDVKENFCHDCGQDLRPTRAAMMAALAPPPDVVTDDMPYLETLDRTDEQLEYVLSRPRVLMGTATSSDIVIDSAFKGWQTASPTHAELRREQEGYLIVDRSSQNGTFVNDTRTGESILADGDTIRLGDVRFIFHIPS